MNGPHHYREAEMILTEIDRYRSTISPEVESSRALRALAHAMLANAAAVALSTRSTDEQRWHDVAGVKLEDGS